MKGLFEITSFKESTSNRSTKGLFTLDPTTNASSEDRDADSLFFIDNSSKGISWKNITNKPSCFNPCIHSIDLVEGNSTGYAYWNNTSKVWSFTTPTTYISSVTNTSTIGLSVSGGGALSANFISMNISQFTNDSGYITTIAGITAGGDLSGTYVNPTVSKINTVPLGSTTATSGNILIADGTSWITRSMSGDATIISTGALTVDWTRGYSITDLRYLQLSGGTLTGNLNGVTPTEITYMSGATSNIQNQINNINLGQSAKIGARVATTANITLSGTQTIDGVAVIVGDRILVKNQTTGANNGVYVVSAGVWSRSTDCTTGGFGSTGVLGMTIVIEEGSTYADQIWMCTTDAPITIGVTTLTFAKSSNTTYTGSGGILLTGNNFTIDTSWAGQTSITTLGIISAGVWNSTLIDSTYGGTGVNNGGRTFTYGGNTTFSGNFTFAGTVTANTAITFPTTGTLATLAGAESLTNKKLGSLTTNGFVRTNSGDGTLSVDTSTYITTVGTGTNNTLTKWSSSSTIGNASSTDDGTTLTDTISHVSTYTSIASTPSSLFKGSWYSGGTSITNRPHNLLEPTPYTSTSVTGVAATDIITVTGNTFVTGSAIYFSTISGGAGLSANTVYYVTTVSGSTFQLATTLTNAYAGTPVINFTTDITSATIFATGVWSTSGTAFGINALLPTYAGVYLDMQGGGHSIFKFSGPNTSPLFTITAAGGSNNAKLLFTGQGNGTDLTIGSSNSATFPSTAYIIEASNSLRISGGATGSGVILFAATSTLTFSNDKSWTTSNTKTWLIPSENNAATPQARVTFGPTQFSTTGTTEAVWAFNGTMTGNATSVATVATVGIRQSQSITPNAGSPLVMGYQQVNTLIASANSQIMYGFHFNTTFTIGAFTGVLAAHAKVAAGSATVAPFEFTSGTVLTTARAGVVEYDGTNLFFTRTGTTRETVMTNVDSTAPTTNTIGVILDYFGISATRVLTTPNGWIGFQDGATLKKIPYYT